jgi:hypothetical protein
VSRHQPSIRRRTPAGGARRQWQWLCASDQIWPGGQLGRSPPDHIDIAAPTATKNAISATKTSEPLMPLVLRRGLGFSSCCCFRLRFFFFFDIALVISRVLLLRFCINGLLCSDSSQASLRARRGAPCAVRVVPSGISRMGGAPRSGMPWARRQYARYLSTSARQRCSSQPSSARTIGSRPARPGRAPSGRVRPIRTLAGGDRRGAGRFPRGRPSGTGRARRSEGTLPPVERSPGSPARPLVQASSRGVAGADAP